AGVRPLKHAEDDAVEVAEAFSNSFHFDVTLLVGSEATKQRIDSEFEKTIQKLKTNDDFIFYFSGQGVTEPSADLLDRKAYLVPFGLKFRQSPTLQEVESQSIDAGDLARRLLQSSGRHRLMLLDSCCSGYAASAGRV